MVSIALFSHALTVLITTLLVSGIWLTAYFVGVKPVKTVNNYYGGTNASCEASVPSPQCGTTCEFVICESIPEGLSFDPKYRIFNSTTSCWMRLMSEAQNEIILASDYWSLLVQDSGDNYTVDADGTAADGKLIYDTLQSTAQRGVDIRIAQNYDEAGNPETEKLEAQSNGKVKVRSLNFKNWYPGGILHTKSWSVDGKHFYVGSANFDWRSLRQVKELGMAVFNCPCLGEDLKNLLEIYWQMGAPNTKLPEVWPPNLSATGNHNKPISVPQPAQTPQAVYLSASPPGFQSCGRESDIETMVKILDEAQEFVDLAVMDYAPCYLYLHDQNSWYPTLDNAIRRAAFDRKVKVRFLLSRWPHTYKSFYSYMYSLQDLSGELPYIWKNSTYTEKGSIEVRFIQVPAMQYGSIPYARVYHNKYFVTDSAAYIGTSNWSADYWETTAGIGIVIRNDDVTGQSFLVSDVRSIFERDWNSAYTIPLTSFDADGNWIANTTEPTKFDFT